MKMKMCLLISLLLVGLVNFTVVDTLESIPKVWDMERLESMHVPVPDTSLEVKPVSEAYYYALPERIAYKRYPFYMPGKEPAGYYESLRKKEPEIIFDVTKMKTEADWIKGGEVVYDMPQNYQVMDSSFFAYLPELAKHWEKSQPITKEGIIPFISIVVRQKGTIELGTISCGMCHTKLMPDGKLVAGGQGNFSFTNFLIADTRVQRDFLKVPDSILHLRMRASQRFIFNAPWVKHESHERLKKISIDDWLNFYETTAGTVNRQGVALGSPVSIPDLFNLSNRKYFDHTGKVRQRDIGDLMRYGTLNQNAEGLHDYGGFTPLPRPADPTKGPITRFSDEQLFALAKFIYSLKAPKNPTHYPKSLLKKGERIFTEQGCVTCHTPPYYSNNKLTPAEGFEIPKAHFKKFDIFDVSVETDPVLALYTRRGTGYYKVPSLIGAWNRTAFLHSGNLANLEDMFDPKRLEPHYVPTGFKPYWLTNMPVNGHRFGMDLGEEDKKALVAFIKSLQ